ncbi:hypothetical protein NDU88_004293 [Pleurodeles waltl]|uniref:Uncharacterized protein n=1 Tax=Pleurodeles waltl TaxID=8319 RepID=A0AAV7L8C1_PLEWA|nr:hypothetical protein NDU88_004293 [Pleurodeles waltl]
MSDDCVRRARDVLEKARRMDLVNAEALGTLHQAWKASHGVTAAVFACSPPRMLSKVAAQEEEELGGGEPDEQRAARRPWREEKAGPRAADLVSSKKSERGVKGLRMLPGDGVKVEILHPLASLFLGSSIRTCQDALGDSRGGGAIANLVAKSFQKARQVQLWSAGVTLEGAQLGRRKAQERPPLLFPGKDSGQQEHMVSVAIEAKEAVGPGAAWLVKGVYMLDAGLQRMVG